MLEQQGNIWEARGKSDWVVITTNGTIRKDGCLVMGRGIAKEAAQKYRWLQAAAGEAIERSGLQVELFQQHKLILFPVKHQFYEEANLTLIQNSAFQLVIQVERLQLLKPGDMSTRILLPRPGCGNGKREWRDVKPILEKYLTDNRYVVFHKVGEE